jgi:hypothetical protein
MVELIPPRHELLDLQGENSFPTGVNYYVEPRGIGLYGIICKPSYELNKAEIERLKLVYKVFEDIPIIVSENGVISVEVSAGTRFGWILSRLAMFYRLSRKPEGGDAE